ncbi:MAG: hypothetical protein FWE77_02230 [Clostridia bacterium]|nr:hypothetical protein [Clostridia bacterium]
MKRILSATLVLALALALCTAASAEVYTHPEAGYSFTVPEGWMVIDGQTAGSAIDLGIALTDLPDDTKAMIEMVKGTPLVILVETSTFGGAINFTSQDTGMAMSVADLLPLANLFEAQFETQFTNYATTLPMSAVTFGEWEAALMGGEFTLGGLRQEMRQVIIPVGTVWYIAVLTAEAGEAAEYEPALAELLSTFSVP